MLVLSKKYTFNAKGKKPLGKALLGGYTYTERNVFIDMSMKTKTEQKISKHIKEQGDIMDLQQTLDRFKADLELYIKEEVARQLAAQSDGVVAAPAVSTSPTDMQVALNSLAELAKVQPATNNSHDAVEQLVTAYGQAPVADPSATVAPAAPQTNVDYMAELQNLGQQRGRNIDTSAVDALTSMDVASAMTQTPQPTDGGQMFGIQSFLKKIRERKNLSSN